MPRTKGRSGELLDGAAIDAMLARDMLDVRWSVRLVNTGGNWTSSANWVYREVPSEAVLLRSRSATLDGGPWQLTLTLLADALPLASVPKAYQRLEVDRVIGTSLWPYFTGVIDSVATDTSLQDGAAVKIYRVEAFGVSQRMKGYWANRISVTPEVLLVTPTPDRALGVCREVRGAFFAEGPGEKQDLPGAMLTYDLANRITLSTNDNYSSPLAYTTAYTVDMSASPARIVWTNHASVPGAGQTVYYEYQRVEHFGTPRYRVRTPDTPPQFFLCPFGRDPQDVFETEVAAYTGGASPTITPKDPTPYSSDATMAGLLDPDDQSPYYSGLTQQEYLAITRSDGTDTFVKIASTNSSGVITLASAPSPAPVPGDTIRVVTTELYSAWDEYGGRYTSFTTDHDVQIGFWRDSGATVNESGGQLSATDTTLTVSAGGGSKFKHGDVLLIDYEQFLVDADPSGDDLTVRRKFNGTDEATHSNGRKIYIEWERNQFEPHPDAGSARSAEKHFSASDSVYITASPIKGPYDGSVSSDANRAEEILKIILGVNYRSYAGIGLFATDDILTYANSGGAYGPTGSFAKNIRRLQIDLADWVGEFKDNTLPPNSYIRDERDGKLSIRSYSVAISPSGRIARSISIQQRADPEPITSAVIISEQEKNELGNMAAAWFYTTTGMDSAVKAAVDGKNDTFSRVARDSTASMYHGGVFQASETVLTVTDGTKFASGQTIAIESERMKVDSISVNNLTLTRGYDSTKAVSHNDGRDIYIVDPKGRGVVTFRIPGVKPVQAFPLIDSIRVVGSGFLTVAIEQGGKAYFVPEATYRPLPGPKTAYSVPDEVLKRAAFAIDAENDWHLRLELYPEAGNPPAAAAQLAEVEILTRTVFAWRAEFSDSLAISYQPDNPTTQFGDTFVATTPGASRAPGTPVGKPGERFSRLWAPTDYLKRVAPKYDADPAKLRHRHKILRLPGISLYDCRRLAEAYLLEETYKATPFVVTAPLDDRIELGDTVSLDFPDGTSRLLFVEGIADGGDLDDPIATYTLTDRSAANRQVV